MWTRLKGSLTLRIFLITSALLMLACGVTYGAIAYLTPISYTSLLEDELNRETQTLLEELSQRRASECEDVLQGFARRTGADIYLMDEYERVLYDTMPAATAVSEGAVTAVSEGAATAVSEGAATAVSEGAATAVSEGATAAVSQDDAPSPAAVIESLDSAVQESAVAWEGEGGAIAGDLLSGTAQAPSGEPQSAQGVIGQVIITEEYAAAQTGHALTFADGTSAFLFVQGGMRAVNQAEEAMKQTLPFLLLVIVGISLLGSFFYAWFITAPIVLISRIAGRIAALDFGVRWTKRRSDEIGVLGDSLNRLADNLSATLTRLEEANRALQHDIERERELDRQRLAFFSAASHELKTPVTILKGQISGMLAQVGVYRDREKYLARSLEVTNRMEGLIREILTISRIESGSFALNAVRVDLGALMKRQLALDEELTQQKRMQLDVRITSGVVVRGNENLLANALDNVLMNAIVYSPPGETIIVRVWDSGFSVENTGVFIAEESLAQVFTPFYRVEQSRNRKSGGSGLGLYLVKSIMELHGASCAMANTERGVCFTAHFKPAAGEVSQGIQNGK